MNPPSLLQCGSASEDDEAQTGDGGARRTFLLVRLQEVFLKVCESEQIEQIEMRKLNLNRRPSARQRLLGKAWLASMMVLGYSVLVDVSQALGQDGRAGIRKANEQVRGYFTDGTNLMYAVGAILGLIGAVKVYQKWSAGDPSTSQIAAAWFGSCVFLVIVATVLRAFFGV